MRSKATRPAVLFQAIAVLAGMNAALVSDTSTAATTEASVSACRTLSDQRQRLRCYDAIALSDTASAHRWSGRNGTDSFAFRATAGTRLLIDHDDAILVGALKDSDGRLLQNLHLAGRGTLSVTIPDDGDYTVTLSATGNWQARLSNND